MSYRTSRPAAALLAVAALACARAGTLDAQELRGRVTVEGGAGQPVEGALVALFPAEAQAADPFASSVAAAFTGVDGAYRLVAPTPGSYVMRIDRIGFESWTSEPYALGAGEVVSESFTLPIRPVRLAQIDVSVVRTCWDDSRDAPAIEVVREEARKALEATRVAERERLFRFNSVIVDRHLATARLGQLSVSTIALENVLETPFRSRPAAELSERGYIQAERDSIWYYAPDASVLLSPEFERDHCFGLERDERDGRVFVGLTFEPRDERRRSDISGVFWLDEETAALERVEFRYENIPYAGVDDDRIEGRIEFAPMPNGAFVVRDWFVRMPQLVAREGSGRFRIRGFTEYGGELRDVLDAGSGEPIRWRPGGVIEGRIEDPIRGGPLADATVTLDRPRGSDIERFSGPGGGFVFDGLEPGRHEIVFDHPILKALDWEPDDLELEIVDGAVVAPVLSLLTPDELLARECGDRYAGGAVVVGHVRPEEASGFGYQGVKVWAEWNEQAPSTDPAAPPDVVLVEGPETRTDGSGRYALCGVPLGRDVIVRYAGSEGLGLARAVHLKRAAGVVEFEVPIPEEAESGRPH